MENPIKIHDLGVPLFLETPISLISKRFVGFYDVICTETWRVATLVPSVPMFFYQDMQRGRGRGGGASKGGKTPKMDGEHFMGKPVFLNYGWFFGGKKW